MLLDSRAISRVRRTSGGVGADFKPAAVAEATETIVATVQPVSGQELERLEAGDRGRVKLKIYTRADVRTADARTGVLADHVVVDAKTYEVAQTMTYEGVLGHTKALLAEVQE